MERSMKADDNRETGENDEKQDRVGGGEDRQGRKS